MDWVYITALRNRISLACDEVPQRKGRQFDEAFRLVDFSAVVLIIRGIMRMIDAIWAFRYDGAVPDDLRDALLGHSLKTYGRVWLIVGVVLVIDGALILGPSERPGAEASRWTGIIAAALGAISAIFVMPYYPVWSLIYIAIAIMMIYGLSAHYGEQATAS